MNRVDQRNVLLPVAASALQVLSWIGAIFLWATLTGGLWRRAWRQPGLVARATDFAGVLVCGAILAYGIVQGIPDRRSRGLWETDQGRQMQAGFLAACERGAYGRVACECLFEELSTGSTASGFTTATQSIQYATLRGDAGLMRPHAAAAMKACRRNA